VGLASANLECTKDYSGNALEVALSRGDRLAGVWEIRFELVNGTLGPSAAANAVLGTLTFGEGTTKALEFPGMRPPLNYGLYNLDFSSFGFETQHDGSAPISVARVSSGGPTSVDSVFVVIEPGGPGPSVMLAGELHNDRVEGAWITASIGRTGIAEWGHFSMTRRNETTVSRPTSSPALPSRRSRERAAPRRVAS
jgi:hypothetical protein